MKVPSSKKKEKLASELESQQEQREMLSEQPESPIDMDMQELETMSGDQKFEFTKDEIEDMQEFVVEFYEDATPELGKYLNRMVPELKTTIKKVQALRAEKNDYEALNVLTEFLEKEMKNLEQVKDDETREKLTALIGSTLNIQKVEKDLTDRSKITAISKGLDIVPGLGPIKMLIECGTGKTLEGKKLNTKQKLVHAGEATAYLALDALGAVALVTTAGTGTVAIEGVKAGTIAARGTKLAVTITRFAHLTKNAKKASKATQALFKMGEFMAKNPKLAGATVKMIEWRRKKQKLAGTKGLEGDIKQTIKFKAGTARKMKSAQLKQAQKRKAA